MGQPLRAALLLLVVGAGLLAAGCGGGSKSSAGGAGAGPLSAESRSAATGDIPDNQVFLVFRDAAAGYSIKYPEGWTQRGRTRDVTFADKNNLIHIVVGTGAAPTPSRVAATLAAQAARTRSLRAGPPRALDVPGPGRAVKLTYSTLSSPNPVTGRRVRLVVDRYVIARAGRQAIIDLGTPQGVDNVDAYRLIVRSFRWR